MPLGLLRFLEEPHAATAPDSAFRHVVRDLVREDPAGAMEWIDGLPPERAASIAPDAFASWTTFQPGAAADWLLELPTSDPRRPELLLSYVNSAAYLPSEAAVEQLRRLGPADRAVARDAISRSGIDEERREDLLGVLTE